MTGAIQIKLLAGILAVLGVIAGLVIRGGRPVEVMSAKPVAAAANQQPSTDDHERQFRRFIAPSKAKKPYLIP